MEKEIMAMGSLVLIHIHSWSQDGLFKKLETL
jgi:hypothetical protein